MEAQIGIQGRKNTVPYGVYVAHGFVSAHLAEQTELTASGQRRCRHRRAPRGDTWIETPDCTPSAPPRCSRLARGTRVETCIQVRDTAASRRV